jgi:hypothetical protein
MGTGYGKANHEKEYSWIMKKMDASVLTKLKLKLRPKVKLFL